MKKQDVANLQEIARLLHSRGDITRAAVAALARELQDFYPDRIDLASFEKEALPALPKPKPKR